MIGKYKFSLWKYWYLLPVFLFYNHTIAQNFNAQVEAALRINDSKDDVLEITGIAINKTEETYSLRYELSVISSDAQNNSSKNSQQGRFTLGAYETRKLSITSVSFNSTQKTILLLVLYDLDDKVVGTARKEYDSEEQEKIEKQISYQKPNEGIVLEGMVTDKTKTKFGKDFYDFFYQKYLLNPNKNRSYNPNRRSYKFWPYHKNFSESRGSGSAPIFWTT